jgi:hypothetical protein
MSKPDAIIINKKGEVTFIMYKTTTALPLTVARNQTETYKRLFEQYKLTDEVKPSKG